MSLSPGAPPFNAGSSYHPPPPPSRASASGGRPEASPQRLAYVYSVPLVHRAVEGTESGELDMLDAAQELQSLRKTLKEAGRKLIFRAEVATVRNFRFLVTLGCRMLHYTGHGNPTCLIFEDGMGEANLLNVETLTELFRAGGVRTQLVFVSACHSESAGHSFAAAGVPHVVAVKYDEKVTDYAARVFAEQFYLSLVTGNTVRTAFHVGVTSIMAESAAAQDQKKFLLLPEGGNHDVAIFDDLAPGDFVDETPREIKNTANKPPVFFLGRNAKVQEVVSLLHPFQRYRCVTIRGPPGIGKTAVAFRVCEYMAERRLFDAIYYVPMNESRFPVTDKEALCETISTALEVVGARSEREIVRALQVSDPNRRVLLLLDGLGRFLVPNSVLVGTLSFLLSKHRGLHLLTTAEGSLQEHGILENTPEKVVDLGELSDLSAAHLLVYVAPRRLRFEEMSTKPFGAKGEALAQLATSPVLKELRGHPKAIISFAPLLEGSRLENLLEAAKRCYREAATRRQEDGRGAADDEPRVVFKDAACERLWHQLTTYGGRRHSFLLGVPWYQLASGLQAQLKEALIAALHGASGAEGEQARGAEGGPPPPPAMEIRGLSESDIGFLRSKLSLQPHSDLVRSKDFEAFCDWWVPVMTTLRLLAKEWLCDSPALLHGFSSRAEAETLLTGREEGLFLVRFSTTHMGTLAISFVASAGVPGRSARPIQHCLVRVTGDGGCELYMDSSPKKYDSMEELIKDCARLVAFYPGVPKTKAFEQLRRRPGP